MTVQFDFWQLILLLLSFFGAAAAAGRLLLGQFQRHIDDRFAAQQEMLSSIQLSNKEEGLQWQRVERELMGLKADLPIAYVRRDDYIRGQSVLESKIDALAMRWENTQLRANLYPGAKP